MSANFTPDMKPYSEPTKFRYWVQSTLPMVYDDGLTYYELLSKVIAYINNLIEDNKTMIDNIDEVYEAFNNLQDYVNNYFDNLDLDPIIDQKVDEEITQLMTDGRMLALIEQLIITSYVPQFVDAEAEMTQRNVVYVLTSNKHIYTYSPDAERFVDSGVIFGDTTEYFTMRGVLANGGNLLNPGDAGLYYLSTNNTYIYTPNGFVDGAAGWEVCFTWSTFSSQAPNNKLIICYQRDRIWIGVRFVGSTANVWLFDNYNDLEAVNISNYSAVSNSSITAEINGGLTNVYAGTIGRLGSNTLYNAPIFDLRHTDNRCMIIPVETGNYIVLKARTFGVDNYCACGFLSDIPSIPTLDQTSFLDVLVNTSYSSRPGKLIMLNTEKPQSLKTMVVNVTQIKYFIVSYRNAETEVNNGYMLDTFKVYRNAEDFAANIVYKDYLVNSPGLKQEFEDFTDHIENLISYDFEFNIENHYLSRYLNNVSYANSDNDYSFSLIAGNSNYKPMDDVERDQNGSIPVGYLLTWTAYPGSNLVNYQVKFGNYTFTSGTNSAYIYNVTPGEYDFEIAALTASTTIANKVVIKTGRAKVNGRIRMLDIEEIYNCRDLGGWKTIHDKKIKYGLFFRSAELDNGTGRGKLLDYGVEQLRKINVVAEIDIDEDENQTLDHYSRYQVNAYKYGIDEDAPLRNNYGAIINQFAENMKAGYGTLVHCRAGVDRTGTVCFLLEGLLGVQEGDLAMDYEISSMNDFQLNPDTDKPNRSQAYRNYTDSTPGRDYKSLVSYIKQSFVGNNISEKIEALLLTLGATQANIDYLKANALE